MLNQLSRFWSDPYLEVEKNASEWTHYKRKPNEKHPKWISINPSNIDVKPFLAPLKKKKISKFHLEVKKIYVEKNKIRTHNEVDISTLHLLNESKE